MRYVVSGFLISAFLFACAGFTGFSSKIVLSDEMKQAIVRLHTVPGKDEKSVFFCTGFFVAADKIVTAAHCVIPTEVYMVKDHENKEVLGIAMTIKYNQRGDQAVLELVTPPVIDRPVLALEQNAQEIDREFMHSEVIACGFAWGGELVCSHVSSPQYHNFFIAALGWLYPGMSGGPVISVDSSKAIGSNTAVLGNLIILAPSVSVLSTE